MTEVFRPSDGKELMTRSALNEGHAPPVDYFRKSTSSRPATQGGGYRFGQLSQNSFFTRHNPHPTRVRHLKGLLDVPICAVNDDGYFSNPRYSLQFPPNAWNQKQIERIPVNAINVNSQLHPINTVTGLQYFTGLTNYPFRERAIPKIGLVPVTEAWRDNLKALTDAIKDNKPEPEQKKYMERPKTQYSESTGRLIPPPSRAMSRGQSRGQSRQGSRQGQRGALGNFQHIAQDPDMEGVVLTMLCQILQTEDINAVQAWLCSAGEREKTMVLDIIRTAMSSQEEYYQRNYPSEFVPEPGATTLPPINEKRDDGKPTTINRLTVEDGGSETIETWKQPAAPAPGATWNQEQAVSQPAAETKRQITSEAFNKPPSRLRSQQNGRVPTPKREGAVVMGDTTLRYTTSSHGKQDPTKEPADPNAGGITSPNTF